MRLIDADALMETLESVYWARENESKYTGNRAIAVTWNDAIVTIKNAPTIEPERCQLTDDDKEVIRIHLNAIKEKLCNQYRWNEAKEYEELIDRLMNLQPERKKGKWIHEYLESTAGGSYPVIRCSECQGAFPFTIEYSYCPICGALMEG